MIPYQHGKHTGDATTLSDKKTSTRLDQIKGDERMASTPDIGWCPNYEADREYLEGRLAAHAMEFFDEGVISV